MTGRPLTRRLRRGIFLAMNDAGRTRLLGALYYPRRVEHGDRPACLYRDYDVFITAWTDAPIPWPHCRALLVWGGSGLLMTEELVRAVKTESAEGIKHWFGAGSAAVWAWRKACGVPKWDTAGSRRLHGALSEAGAAELRGKRLPEKLVERRGAARKARRSGWPSNSPCSAIQPASARRIGRTTVAVHVMRTRLDIPSARDQRRREHRQQEGTP